MKNLDDVIIGAGNHPIMPGISPCERDGSENGFQTSVFSRLAISIVIMLFDIEIL